MDKTILYFQCSSGISGDMTVAALLDLGIDEKRFLEELAKLHLEGYSTVIRHMEKDGITGTDFQVLLEQAEEDSEHHHHGHRGLAEIQAMIENSTVSQRTKELSIAIFQNVAKAEAKIHGKPVEQVHFHEVGAVDSIVDIVGCAICIDLLGVDEIYASPVHTGTGFVQCQHGWLPVPAPATLELLKGKPIYSKGIEHELVTPTGAAILVTLAADFGPVPDMVLEGVGYGFGKTELPIKNMLRVLKGKKKPQLKLT
ncbi:nickel pincer cofactor biosynthesis protein LarC [Bianquea renquensis]|uniref:Nickel pincer cofactor biosynthesis protein LarC n=1 Tax=Bianquea renquensis TaxID=2763661 RepID=A0A926DVT3_9FIRM|nr:nickel pincer cofactor biosynthesis protein LarC [Bianquea renquensis]MBC8544767.1 nickel pincer cofactor biosynthesis protein LarC [Bianquea renquensis]